MLGIVMRAEKDFGPLVADEIIVSLQQAFDRLAEFPEIGHLREDLTSDVRVRFWSVAPTLIAYRREAAGIVILLVERAALDWQRFGGDFM